jgi:DNA-binding LacI/PurR family transcriptional regulator
MSGRARRVTAADVAREAGVSAATVSYVVNDKPGQTIPPETRERVLAAATRLGYAPYAPARTLALGASNLVLFAHRAPIVPPTYARYLEALADGLHDHGLDLVWQLGYEPSAGARHPAAELAPAVVLHLTEPDPDEAAYLDRFGAPVIVALASAPLPDRPSALQVRHLAERGHRTLGYAAHPDPRLAAFDRSRYQTVRETCASLGLPAPSAHTIPLSRDAARQAVADLLETGVTGICAYNDEIAFAVLAGLSDLRVDVPAQAAVVGIDDHPLAALYTPSLTTISLDDPATSAADLVRRIAAARTGAPIPPAAPAPPARLIPRAST